MKPDFNQIPQEFLDRLEEIIPKTLISNVLYSFEAKRKQHIRINPLRSEAEDGREYIQGLSSQLVPVILDPQPEERILDLCAAPGSKTSQMAALMNNTGQIVAVERVRERMYRLKSVLALLGVTNTHCHLGDGRAYQSDELFDRVLVDAPCSSEGRFVKTHPKTFRYWSKRKIREMRRKQRGLLQQGVHLVKPGGIVVYSTCTFAPEENEGVIDWILRKSKHSLSVEEVELSVQTYPSLLSWADKNFNEEVSKTKRILPTDEYEGFFIAKLRKS